MAKRKINFEDSLEQLKNIINKLEEDNISLDESIELYKKGINLSKKCDTYLSEAKQQVVIINDENI